MADLAMGPMGSYYARLVEGVLCRKTKRPTGEWSTPREPQGSIIRCATYKLVDARLLGTIFGL